MLKKLLSIFALVLLGSCSLTLGRYEPFLCTDLPDPDQACTNAFGEVGANSSCITHQCVAGECMALSGETCDGKDNDCDGVIDETVFELGVSSSVSATGFAVSGGLRVETIADQTRILGGNGTNRTLTDTALSTFGGEDDGVLQTSKVWSSMMLPDELTLVAGLQAMGCAGGAVQTALLNSEGDLLPVGDNVVESAVSEGVSIIEPNGCSSVEGCDGDECKVTDLSFASDTENAILFGVETHADNTKNQIGVIALSPLNRKVEAGGDGKFVLLSGTASTSAPAVAPIEQGSGAYPSLVAYADDTNNIVVSVVQPFNVRANWPKLKDTLCTNDGACDDPDPEGVSACINPNAAGIGPLEGFACSNQICPADTVVDRDCDQGFCCVEQASANTILTCEEGNLAFTADYRVDCVTTVGGRMCGTRLEICNCPDGAQGACCCGKADSGLGTAPVFQCKENDRGTARACFPSMGPLAPPSVLDAVTPIVMLPVTGQVDNLQIAVHPKGNLAKVGLVYTEGSSVVFRSLELNITTTTVMKMTDAVVVATDVDNLAAGRPTLLWSYEPFFVGGARTNDKGWYVGWVNRGAPQVVRISDEDGQLFDDAPLTPTLDRSGVSLLTFFMDDDAELRYITLDGSNFATGSMNCTPPAVSE